MNSKQKNAILEDYISNSMAKLKRLSYPLFARFGGISGKDYDEFYSIANLELWKATDAFDESNGAPFEYYLKSCLLRKFKTEMTGMNREKRKADRLSMSLEAPYGEDESATLGDLLASDFDIEKEVLGLDGDEGAKIDKYMDKLSKIQQAIVRLLASGYKPVEIQEILHISSKIYSDCMRAIQSYENIKVLM